MNENAEDYRLGTTNTDGSAGSAGSGRSGILRFAVVLLAAAAVGGCQSAYYKGMEQIGYHKRDLLVSRVESARDAQSAAKDQFKTALERFSSVVNFDGGDLQKTYNRLNSEFERCETRADTVRERIESVEDVARALFNEWEAELAGYTNTNLRASSQRKLDATKERYDQYIVAMRRAEDRMEPVLAAFRDQVLYLKHNLNAQAIASLQSELVSVEADVASLIQEMELSISEADAFIRQFGES